MSILSYVSDWGLYDTQALVRSAACMVRLSNPSCIEITVFARTDEIGN